MAYDESGSDDLTKAEFEVKFWVMVMEEERPKRFGILAHGCAGMIFDN